MDENLHDLIEMMEGMVPEYTYDSVTDIVKTDKAVRNHLISEMKKIKEYLFHVVQISYELQRDKLTHSSERAWDDVDSLIDSLQNSKISKLEGDKEHCEECKKKMESDMASLVRRDKELVNSVIDAKRLVILIYRDLLDKGKERSFIKNINKIKKDFSQIQDLIDLRERHILGDYHERMEQS